MLWSGVLMQQVLQNDEEKRGRNSLSYYAFHEYEAEHSGDVLKYCYFPDAQW
jgi:hypothetical protein